jgi:hypothetical protein
MDHADRIRLFSLLSRFQERIRRIQAGFENSIRNRAAGGVRFLERSRRSALGILLLSGAMILGAWAHENSRRNALEDWESHHAPSRSVWQTALAARGLARMTEERQLARASRSLPVAIDSVGAVWFGKDIHAGTGRTRIWIAVFTDPESATPVDFHCLGCSGLPPAWEPAGRGWRGFETALAMVEKTLSGIPTPLAQPTKKRAFHDPREIRY